MMKKYTRLNQRIRAKLFNEWMNLKTYIQVLLSRRNQVYLFGCPIHANVGDQAQLYCISGILRKQFPKHQLVLLNWRCSGKRMLRLIRKKIRQEDQIFFHSGYFMVEHHNELPVYRKVVDLFHDQPIVIFPQTINFSDPAAEELTARSFNAHPNLILMCRDEISYAAAQKIFNGCKLLLYPDVVTSLIGCRSFEHKREGILFCMRNDPEAYYKPEQIEELMSTLGADHEVRLSDTSISATRSKLEKNRGLIVEEMIESFAKYKLIITDRYHGTIFSLIANTPVIVLASADHKLSSGVKWFPDSFSERVSFISELRDVKNLALEQCGSPDLENPKPYFANKFYDDLWDRLDKVAD